MIIHGIKWETLKELSLMQLEKVPYKWFSAMCCEGYSVPGPMIIKKKKKLSLFLFWKANWKTEDCVLNDSKDI